MVIKECDPGWDKIIDPLIELCKKRKVKILQIKEKFGRLRFYVNFSTETIDQLIEEAENESARTCELCGEPGELRSYNGWLKTVCVAHTPKMDVLS